MIRSFKDSRTEAVWKRQRVSAFGSDLQRQAQRKLNILNAAVTLGDANSPPGNRLEKMKGDREGQHSIRINDQFRICFVWTKDGPAEVEITDYHD